MGRNKTSLLRIRLLALAAAGALVMDACHRTHGPPQVGDSAPNFVLPALGQGSITLREHRDRVVILNFWATWCPPCVEETPSLEKFAAQMRDAGMTVIGVSVDEDAAALAKFVADYRLSFPIARDPGQVIAGRYGSFKFPETYILDRHGRIAEKIIGAIDWQDPRIIGYVRELAKSGSHSAQ